MDYVDNKLHIKRVYLHFQNMAAGKAKPTSAPTNLYTYFITKFSDKLFYSLPSNTLPVFYLY